MARTHTHTSVSNTVCTCIPHRLEQMFNLCASVIQHVCLFLCLFRSVFPIHPSFRVLALAEPPVVGTGAGSNSRAQQWLGPEVLTMFLYHNVMPLAKEEEMGLIQGLVRHTNTETTLSTSVLTNSYFFYIPASPVLYSSVGKG